MTQAKTRTMPSDEVLIQAGRITSNFVLLECSMTELTHLLLGVPRNIAKTVTADLSFHAVQALAVSLAKERVPARCGDLKKIVRLMKRAEEKKDAVSCFLWGREIAGGRRRQERLQSRLRLEDGDLTVGELLDIAGEIANLVREVERLRVSIEKAIGPASGQPRA